MYDATILHIVFFINGIESFNSRIQWKVILYLAIDSSRNMEDGESINYTACSLLP